TMFSMFEPITVYQNYGSIKLPALFSFYSIRNKSGSWILFICLFTASMLILMIQSIKYCHFDYDEKKKELVIEERINGAALSSSILIHGIKNQLLSSEILINTLKANDCVKSDMEVNEKVNQLSEINSFMLRRLNILYRSFIKINTVLQEVRSSTVFDLVKDKLGPDCDFISYSIDDVKLLCDPDLLSEAIYNIVRNAVEATEGKPDRAVGIALRNTRTRILITISDNGPGISAKSRKDIFNPFFSTKNSQTNWGLGLSYANMVVRKHRGSIQFESSAEKGTVFLIDLPRVEV
ncbi:MAG: HAMP domain-containing histidine kinase, partial [Spirochaetales bacterium]|nr:HAMP domain-containing histidine kinase [Spirochaetales bacterium]